MNDLETRAYKWALQQTYQSVAARYAKVLAEYIKKAGAELPPTNLSYITFSDGMKKEDTSIVGILNRLIVDSDLLEVITCLDIIANEQAVSIFATTVDGRPIYPVKTGLKGE